MELRQLEYFSTVSKLKSFTHAAEELHVSQPSITHAIHKLEEELGVQLFERKTKKVVLTVKGEIFYKRVTNILMSISEAVSEIKNIDIGTVKIGLPPMIGAHLFPNVYLEFSKAYPQIELQVVEKGSLYIRNLLEQGQLDIGFIIIPDHSYTLDTIPLVKQQMMACLPHNHRFAHEKRLRLKQLLEEKFVFLSEEFVHHRIAFKECLKHGFTPDVIFSSDQVETVKALVAKGAGITLLMNMIVENDPNIVKVPLDPPIEINIGLAWKKDRHLSKECINTLHFIQNYFSDSLQCLTN